jgi:hypothetical protein
LGGLAELSIKEAEKKETIKDWQEYPVWNMVYRLGWIT